MKNEFFRDLVFWLKNIHADDGKHDIDFDFAIKLTKEMFQEAAQLSVDMINYFNERDKAPNQRLLLLALAISYVTLSKGTNVTLHQAMEVIMTVYKNTEIVND